MENAGDEINDSPIEQVQLVVPITDDTSWPTLTFRTWVLGPATCIFLAITTQFFNKRQNVINIPSTCCSMLLLLVGKFMAKTLPNRNIKIPGTRSMFSLNPGPFNMKEHILISIFANTGLDNPFSLTLVTIAKAFFHTNISFWASFLLVQTSQMIGYGFAGMFMNFLVNSPYMWWPLTLLDVSFYRVLHEEEKRPKGHLTKLQFFWIVTVSSFAYYLIPNYFFPSITALSFVCWIWKQSVTAQQIGSGLNGFGVGSFTLDWSTITTFLGSPLALPTFTIINSMVGFILILYIITPIAYWTNSYQAKRFPVFSNALFDFNGQTYNVSRVLDNHLKLNEQAYSGYSSIYLSVFSVFRYGCLFGSEAAIVTHFLLFHGRETWCQLKQAMNHQSRNGDVHNRMMDKYESIPWYWFHAILVSMIGLAILNCKLFEEQIQLPYWGVLLGCLLPFLLILPVGVLAATTGQTFGIFGISEILMGYLYHGKPLANLAFASYGGSTMMHTFNFLQDFKLAHYMKIPPKSMFIVQMAGAFISYSTNLAILWWLLSSVDNVCDQKKLPRGSPWTCPSDHQVFSTSMIWGGVGPSRMFAPHGVYSKIYWFFLIGVIATLVVWILSQMYPAKNWIKLINVPIILGVAKLMPPAGAVHYWSWFTVAIVFNSFVYTKYKGWWRRYNYVLSNGLDFGIACMALLAGISLQLNDVYGVNWWGLELDDHCPLATCPTAPGIEVDGCPNFQK